MLIIDCEQRSNEWMTERLGKPSASRFDEIITAKGEQSKQRTGYMYELSAQILTGKSQETFVTPAMEEGINREDESRKLYELIHGVSVQQVGMIFPDENKQFLCSPDGIIDMKYGLELKNVLPKTQKEYLLSNKLPPKYFTQIQGSLLVSGFDRWDFMSYCPGLKPLIVVCNRDEKWIEKCDKELKSFNQELSEMVKELA